MAIPQKPDPYRECEMCGKPLIRKRFASGRLEDRTAFLKRRHCSRTCGNSRKEIQLDSHRWRARQITPKDSCEGCGTSERLHVHHHDRNPANNDPTNLAVLCASCHLTLHWREDREARVAAVRTGVSTSRQSGAGNESSVAARRRRHNSARRVDPGWTPASLSS